jgi:Nucleotidyl transferase AbiEii toxin, Type IV TA system/X-Pro dipeptidyl-peptidase (S15 family)
MRPIAHAYDDALPPPAAVRSYCFEEVFAEKLRAMGERSRPRDLYDIVNLYRRPASQPQPLSHRRDRRRRRRPDHEGLLMREAIQFDVMRETIEFDADGKTLRGWLFRPDGPTPASGWPAVAMAHGYSAVKELLVGTAERFAAAGLAVLLYDHPNLGESGGEPRQHVDPWEQARGYRHAVTCLAGVEDVDAERIGIWGTSFAGGHVLVAAAVD